MSSKKIKYVAVYWIRDEQFSIHGVECVLNQEMLYNPKLVGDVEHTGKKTEKPATGWKKYPGRIIAVGGIFSK